MNTQVIFWFLITMGIIQMIAIYLMGTAIRSLVTSDMFKKKVVSMGEAQEKESASKSSSNGAKELGVLLLLLAPQFLFAATEATVENDGFTMVVGESELYVALVINILLLGILLFMKRILTSLLRVDKKPVEEPEIDLSVGAKKFLHILTDAVPLDQEETVETDHEYDGIRELDNNLPPWWKYGFYLSIAVAVLYLINYHVLKTGDLQIAEYERTMEEEQAKVDAYLISQALNVDENSVVMLTEEADLSRGKGLFMKYCKVCHGANGEGLVGPNMTDDYWIYGNDIKNIFTTVKYGAKNGMKSWKDELNPVQMQQVSSYIKTLQATDPPNQKEPQGDKYELEETPVSGAENTAEESDEVTANLR